MAFVGNVIARVGADISEFQRNMQQAQRTLLRTGQNLRNIGASMTAYISAPIIALGAASVKLASDMQESINKVDVAFKENSNEVKNWSETTLKSFGIAKGTALDMAALFGDMATSQGLATKEAAKMSMSLTGLAGDLASFKNIGIDQAQTALKSIFTGETESLKELGIVMTQANLQAFALQKGMNGNIEKMTEAEKVQLRYAFVMERTVNSQGDFIRTNSGAANQMRIFQESLKEIGTKIGEVMLPVFTSIITKVNEFIQYFGTLSQSSREFIVIAGLITAALGPIIFIVGTLITSFGVIAGAIAAVSAPIWITIGALAALTAGAIYLWTTNEGFRKFILSTWEEIKSFLVTTWGYIEQIGITVFGALSSFWTQNQNGIIQMFSVAWSFLWNTILSPWWNFISNTAKTIFDGLSLFWSIWGENLKNVFEIAWDAISTVFSGAVTIITGIFKVLEGLFTGNWSKMWEGAKDIFTGVWTAIIGSLKGFINIMINSLNALIVGLNRMSFSMPNWIPGIGGKSFSLNIPQIPLLANGGIINTPTLSMIGEAGSEAVIPLENSSFIDSFASKVASAMVGAMKFNSSNQNSSSGDIILQIDGTQLARILEPYQAKENQRTGNKLIIQGV